jgi:hypothetical protein
MIPFFISETSADLDSPAPADFRAVFQISVAILDQKLEHTEFSGVYIDTKTPVLLSSG